jgi:exodeoxyribonuclease VII large subunit
VFFCSLFESALFVTFFPKVRPAEKLPPLSESAVTSTPANQPPRIFRLAAVTTRIRDLLLEVSARRFWVRAQLVARSAARSGHFYGELLDVENDGQTVAKMSAVIWRSNLEVIRRKLEIAGASELLEGNREICALCSVTYHEVHGLSLQILDVDPTFGEAHIDRNRRLILERLAAEGLMKANACRSVPAAPLVIGLVTAAGSAAANDFLRTISDSPYSFRVIVASAAMQGERLEAEVVGALQSLARLPVDLIAVVRGGGSPVDLAWFDNEPVARAIATMPVPVWVGIGHEIDTGVPDHVAHTSFKTPTAVAEALVQQLAGLEDRLLIAADRLDALSTRPIELAERALERSHNGLSQGTRKLLALAESQLAAQLSRLRASAFQASFARDTRLSEATASLRAGTLHHVGDAESRLQDAGTLAHRSSSRSLQQKQFQLSGLRQRLRKPRYNRTIEIAGDRLGQLEQRLDALRPERVLRRGYALIRDAAGRPITSVAAVATGQRLTTTLADGSLTSQVESTSAASTTPHEHDATATPHT